MRLGQRGSSPNCIRPSNVETNHLSLHLSPGVVSFARRGSLVASSSPTPTSTRTPLVCVTTTTLSAMVTSVV